MIRVLIAEDHKLVRRAIREALTQIAGFIVVGEAANGQEAVALAETEQPDVILIDLAMPAMNGLGTIRQIQQLEIPTRFIIFSLYFSPSLIKLAQQHGAHGYLSKSGDPVLLFQAIRAVAAGETFFGSESDSD